MLLKLCPVFVQRILSAACGIGPTIANVLKLLMSNDKFAIFLEMMGQITKSRGW